MPRYLPILFCLLLSLPHLHAQTLTLTSPNGGEGIVGCSQFTITWADVGTSNAYSIDYSTDGGGTWTSVTSFYSTTTGTYDWTVPNVSSSNALIRIVDSNNGSVSDVSDAVFTIIAPLIFTAPNGGEDWLAGSSQQITWAASGTSNRYNIEYSIDAGVNWSAITSSTYNTSGSYNWSVPNTPSNAALVRVTDYYNSCMTDGSDNLFTISPPNQTISINSPSIGSTLYVGATQTISWSSAYLSSPFVMLEYSSDNGVTWNTIEAATNDDGSYSWTVPNNITSQAFVRISEVGNPSVNDVEGPFTIAPPFIDVLAPDGGESLDACESYSIRWSNGGIPSSRYRISYSLDNGTNWTTITSNYYNSSTTNATYSWTVPNINSTDALVRVQAYYDNSIQGISNATFTTNRNTDIIVNTPNGGEMWEAGQSYTITWAHIASLNRFEVQYSTDGGNNWTNIANSVYGSSYTWTVPNDVSTNCYVRVLNYYDNCEWDASDASFSITPPTPYIEVNSPNGGNTLYVGNSYSITWDADYLSSSFVVLEYSTDNGGTWNTISNAVDASLGTYSWTVPNAISTQCLVRISELGNLSLYDESNSVFTIRDPYITILNPNGGETWIGCESEQIQWQAFGIPGNRFRLYYSTNGGTTWTTVTTNYYNSGSTKTYTWDVANVASTNALIKVEDYNNSATYDESNSPSTFVKNTDIVATSPNGGEQWEVGTQQTITWAYDNSINRFTLQYSTDGGSSWSTITSSTYNTGSYNWTVPNDVSNDCYVRILSYYDNCIRDENDVAFAITPPTPYIEVNTPNGGNTLYVGNSYTISWDAEYLSSNFVLIEYSADNGATWNTVTAAIDAVVGTYPWTVPNDVSTQCLIRISELGNAALYDESNSVFTIREPYITVLSPNGGESWIGCETESIQWQAFGIPGNRFGIQYSTNQGSSWTTITSNYYSSSSTKSYNWDVANLDVDSALVRIYDYNNNATEDISDTYFTLNRNLDIITTTPNGGESWEVGTQQTITWAYDNSISRFTLQYSTNGGSGWSTITSSTYNAGSYNWTVPNDVSNDCYVRVLSYYDNCIRDENDMAFSITPPTPYITVNSPNGGNTLYVGNSYTIGWSADYLSSSFVVIEYSADNGATWNTISPAVDESIGSYSWTVPNDISTQCLVRISELGNPSVSDVSNSVFTIREPYIEVVNPNGGEVWTGCETESIQWRGYGIPGHRYRVYYSLNGGSTWTTILSNYYNSSSTKTYNWDVANITSTNVLIKVEDYNNSATYDESDSPLNFLKNTDIVTTTPNGGEQWEVGTVQTITWAYDNSINRFTLQYSTNGGSGWSTITSSTYNAGTYNWTIPNTISNDCYVRVLSYYDNCIQDANDAAFSITPPTPYIEVNSPNGGNTLYVSNSYTISWDAEYLSSNFVLIEYSSDNGVTWNTISAAIDAALGSYVWTVPNDISTQCLIRISELGNPSLYDESNSVFTIRDPYVVLLNPNGGNSLTGCEAYSIQWQAFGVADHRFNLQYSPDSGATWNTITSNLYNSSSTKSYSWDPVNQAMDHALVRVQARNYPGEDESDSTFVVNKNTDVILSSPNGGENFEAGLTYPITWAYDNSVNRFVIQYSTNGGSGWSTITSSTYNAGTYNWTVPNTPSPTCKVRVLNYYDNCEADESDQIFNISPPTPTITLNSPNGPSSLYTYQSYNISWSSAFLSSSYVTLEYSKDNGQTWELIASPVNDNNGGTYNWTVPNEVASDVLVRVSELNNPSVYDVSNQSFSIEPAILVTSPNGDNGIESWRGCTQTTINWSSGGTNSYYRLDYSLDNGTNWISINSSYYSPGNTHSYTWTIPNSPSSDCLVRVRDRNALHKEDISDNTFTITTPVTLLQPNNGDILHAGDTYDIKWLAAGTSTYYNIDYSVDGGSSWISIVFNQNNTTGIYPWTIPTNPSANCLVRVTDNIDNCKVDQTEIPFTISLDPAELTVTYPNGSDTLTGCGTHTITWTQTANVSSFVNIDYSADGGLTWQNIVSTYNATQPNYTWSVPNIETQALLVRVTDAANANYTDQSNSVSVLEQAVVASISLIGSSEFCEGESVFLTSNSLSGNYWSPTGETTQTIEVSSTGTYTLTVTSPGSGCSATSDPISLTEHPAPTAFAGADTILASGDSVLLGGSPTGSGGTGALAYLWTPETYISSAFAPNPLVFPQTSTTYSLTVRDEMGCVGTDQVVIGIGCGRDIFEDNNSMASAAELPDVGVLGNATICNAGDVDWYWFEVGSDPHISIKLTGLPADFDLEVYDELMNLVGSSLSKNTDSEFVAFNNAIQGTRYFIKVYGGSPEVWSVQGYHLRVHSRNMPFGLIQKEEEASLDLTQEYHVDVYPNPTEQYVNIRTNGLRGKTNFSLFNAMGQPLLLEEWQLDGDLTKEIELEGIPAGIYFYRITHPEYETSGELVIY